MIAGRWRIGLDAGDRRVLTGRLGGFAVHAAEYFRTGNRPVTEETARLFGKEAIACLVVVLEQRVCIYIYIAVASGLLRSVGRLLLARAGKGLFF